MLSGPLLDWMKHVGGLAAFTALHNGLSAPLQQVAQSPVLSDKQKYVLNRTLETWEFGAGLDYKL